MGGGVENWKIYETKKPKLTLLADNPQGLITKPRPVASAAPHPITPEKQWSKSQMYGRSGSEGINQWKKNVGRGAWNNEEKNPHTTPGIVPLRNFFSSLRDSGFLLGGGGEKMEWLWKTKNKTKEKNPESTLLASIWDTPYYT